MWTIEYDDVFATIAIEARITTNSVQKPARADSFIFMLDVLRPRQSQLLYLIVMHTQERVIFRGAMFGQLKDIQLPSILLLYICTNIDLSSITTSVLRKAAGLTIALLRAWLRTLSVYPQC